MTAMSTYLEDAYLNHILGGAAMTAVATPYVQLHNQNPTETGAVGVIEDDSRQAATFGAAAGLVATTTADIVWTLALTGPATVSHLSIWDNATPGAGNCLYYGAFSASDTFNNNDQLTIATGDLDVTLSGNFTTYSANAFLDHTLGVAAWTQPPGRFVKLYTAAPGVDPGVTNEYADTRRISATFGAASAGASDNTNEILWTSVTATATVTDIAIFDTVGPAGGNPLLQQTITVNKALTTGNDAKFNIGDLDVTAN